jgi:hypothetical protein
MWEELESPVTYLNNSYYFLARLREPSVCSSSEAISNDIDYEEEMQIKNKSLFKNIGKGHHKSHSSGKAMIKDVVKRDNS